MGVLAFAGACTMASIYGLLQGARPFGVVEAIWAAVAGHRWRIRMRTELFRLITGRIAAKFRRVKGLQ